MSKELFMSLYDEHRDATEGRNVSLLNSLVYRTNTLIGASNATNDDILVELDKFAINVSAIRSRMAEAVSAMTSINTVSGNSNLEYELSKLNIKESKNIQFDGSRISLTTQLVETHPIVDVIIDTNGQIGNSSDYEEKRFYNKSSITTQTKVEIEKINTGVMATITIELGQVRVLNQVRMKLSEFGIQKPIISDVELSKDSESYITTDYLISEADGYTSIDIQDNNAKSVRFTISQNSGYLAKDSSKRFPIGISELAVGISTAADDGYVIYGPLTSSGEIIKAAIAGEIPNDAFSIDQIRFYISHNATDWEEVTVPWSLSNLPKYISYNTIEKNSVSTKEDVNSIYVRVNLTSKEIEKSYVNKDAFSLHTQSVSSSYPTITTPFIIGTDNLIGEDTYINYGNRLSRENIKINPDRPDYTLYISKSNQYLIKGLNDIEWTGEVGVKFDYKKCTMIKDGTYIIDPSVETDIYNTTFYKFSNPVRKTISTNDKVSNIVIPFSNKAGVYRLTDGVNYKYIDLSSGYFSSCYQYIYQNDGKEIYLLDTLGNIVHKWDTSKAYINLLDWFSYEEPVAADGSIVKTKFNKNYPGEELKDKEFSIIGYRVFSTNHSAYIDADIIEMQKMQHSIDFGLKNIIYRTETARLAKYKEKLSDADGKNVAKLSKTNILRGSLKFEYNEASIFSFVEEVDYINGRDEFNTGNIVEVQVPKSVNYFSLEREIDKFSKIKLIGHTEIFKNRVYSTNELVDKGDYIVLSPNEHNYTQYKNESIIQLPENVFTHDIINTKAVLDSPITGVGNGYYSVDYDNGILYSQTLIDGNIKADYKYSNVFMSANEIERYDRDSYKINGQQVVFKILPDNRKVVIVSRNAEVYKLKINRTPYVSAMALNITGG